MKFLDNPNPYMRSPRSTFKIMMELMIGLLLVWLASIIYYFVREGGNPINGVCAILMVPIAVLSCCLSEILFFIPKWRKEENHSLKSLLLKEVNSFGYITGIILALLMPVGVNSLWQVALASVVAVVVCKMLFGGFGYNIFNPAIVGRLFAGVCFGSSFDYQTVVNKGGNLSIEAGPTVLTSWANGSWSFNSLYHTGLNKFDIFFGNYSGCLGETFTFLILIVGLVLMIRKVIDYRIVISYLAMCGLTALIVGLQTKNAFSFACYQICTGGIVFGAVFCLTDPVTSPTSPLGKILFGALAGFMTMLIRFRGSSAEGVALSIITVNMLTPLIDNCLKGRTTDKFARNASIVGALCLVMLLVSFAYKINQPIVNNNESLVQETAQKQNYIECNNILILEEEK